MGSEFSGLGVQGLCRPGPPTDNGNYAEVLAILLTV